MRVIVAEKPSMGRAIAAALGIRGGAGQGSLGAGGVVVTWCIGHLVSLADPEDYDPALKDWTRATLPILPSPFRLKLEPRTRAQFQLVAGLLSRRDVVDVVNACDSGREGELIFDLVYRQAGGSRPVHRLWTASLTEDAIREAYRTMKPASAYAGLRDAARCRQEADWLVGLNATRAMTLAARAPGLAPQAGPVGPPRRAAGRRGRHASGPAAGGAGGVWSVGRVQTPTLALVVERHLAIERFVPASYFTVTARLAVRGAEFAATWFRLGANGKPVERLEKKEAAHAIVTATRGQPARVIRVDKKERRTPPPLLYDLTTLQREANRRFGFTATKTLGLAQELYETAKVLSYPRTSSRHLTADVARTVPALLEALSRDPAYAALAGIARRAAPLGARFVDDTKVEDHHALLPTGRVPAQLEPDQRRIYDLVVRRLLAAHLPDRVERVGTAVIAIAREKFRSRGTTLLAAGWTEVDPPAAAAPPGRRSGEQLEDATPLPALHEGDAPEVLRIAPKAGKTTPPRPYTEGDLLGAMETAGRELEDEDLAAAMKDSGLGTPATRAAILEALLDRGYLVRAKKMLAPTAKALTLLRNLDGPELPSTTAARPSAVRALKSAALTGAWEAKLAAMARGAYARDRFMAEVADFARELVLWLSASLVHRAPAGATSPDPFERSTAQRDVPASARVAVPAGQSPSAAPPPAAGKCPGCGTVPRVLFSRAKATWFRRCDRCRRWLADSEPRSTTTRR